MRSALCRARETDAGGEDQAFGRDGGGGGTGTSVTVNVELEVQNVCELAGWLFLASVLHIKVSELSSPFILQVTKQIQRVEVTRSRSHCW